MNHIFQEIKRGNYCVLAGEQYRWLRYLCFTREAHVNIERVECISDIKASLVLKYVRRTFERLETLSLSSDARYLVEEALKWCEVSKCGLPKQREMWKRAGYNLHVHNVGSAQIYMDEAPAATRFGGHEREIVYTLILTHGLIGQYLRGEVNFGENRPLTGLLEKGAIGKKLLREVLAALNNCVVYAVSADLWNSRCGTFLAAVDRVVEGDYSEEFEPEERILRLRGVSRAMGEDTPGLYRELVEGTETEELLWGLFRDVHLWYVESALAPFDFEEFAKIMLMAAKRCGGDIKDISFEPLMYELYYDYQGRKATNLYKKRIIEKYLSEISVADILEERIPAGEHVSFSAVPDPELPDTLRVTFKFSAAGRKLIEFCVEAEKSVIYERAILLLFDMYGFRRDQYDRFNNEGSYLKTMHDTTDAKAVILDYVVGDAIVDIGPGSGGLMDRLEERFPKAKIVGLDASRNVMKELNRRSRKEGHRWRVVHGDITTIGSILESPTYCAVVACFEGFKATTVIFSSVLHEIFSYNKIDGQPFDYRSLEAALESAFYMLAPGGRIIIRDGIMTDECAGDRIIRFKDSDGMAFLRRYAKDFKGRQIQYRTISPNEVIMPINDAMEFLYTYTWGEASYAFEIQEQFGYFTPAGYRKFIERVLGKEAQIVVFDHYLQPGYEEYLLPKIDFLHTDGTPSKLPDSTCLIVIERKHVV